MRRVILVCAVALPAMFFVSPYALGQDGAGRAENDPSIAQLQAQVAALERRVSELEAKLAQAEQAVEARRAGWQAKARERMAGDRERHTVEELREAERLYQVANRNWRSPEAKAALAQMVERFPDVNRTGCALVYLGQMSEGQEKVEYLKRAMERHADSFYGDGVQAGPYAMFLLAHHYAASGQADEAGPLIEAIRRDHAEAIDHRGQLLVERLPE